MELSRPLKGRSVIILLELGLGKMVSIHVNRTVYKQVGLTTRPSGQNNNSESIFEARELAVSSLKLEALIDKFSIY